MEIKRMQLATEARDVHATIASLSTLASHPKTPEHEAAAARVAISRLRKAHGIPEPEEPPKPAQPQAPKRPGADYHSDIAAAVDRHDAYLRRDKDSNSPLHMIRDHEATVERLSVKHGVPRSQIKDHIWNAHMAKRQEETERQREEEMSRAKAAPEWDPKVKSSRELHGDVRSTVRKHKEHLDREARGTPIQTGDGFERKKSAFHHHVMKMAAKHGVHMSEYNGLVTKLHKQLHPLHESTYNVVRRVLREQV